MPHLYVTRQGASLHKRGDRVEVRDEGVTLFSAPLRRLDGIVLVGNVQASTQILRHLAESSVPLFLMTYGGRLVARLVPPLGRNVFLRVRQVHLSQDSTFVLETARAIVRTKIGGELALLESHRSNHPVEGFEEARRRLRELALAADECRSPDEARGIEGTAARTYYRILRNLVRDEMEFQTRTRRPPTDPVNALLSLGYVLVGSRLASLLEAVGLDPFIGFLHDLQYGRPSLGQDFLEEFRAPCVDRFTLALLNRRQVRLEDFETHPETGAVQLTQEGSRRYFTAFERYMQGTEGSRPAVLDEGGDTWEERWRARAARWAAAIREACPYRPEDWDARGIGARGTGLRVAS